MLHFAAKFNMAGVKRQTAIDDTAVSAKKQKVSSDLKIPVDQGFAAGSTSAKSLCPGLDSHPSSKSFRIH